MLCENCVPRELEAMRALESLTPSGSEFVNDVERCVNHVRDYQRELMNTLVRVTKHRNKLREALEAVLQANRGTSGRLILEAYQEYDIKKALGVK